MSILNRYQHSQLNQQDAGGQMAASHLTLPPPVEHPVQITAINARTVSRCLDLSFEDGRAVSLPFELLRVYSPSAEVRGHGEGQEVLQFGKRSVSIAGIEPVGNYAIKLLFTDGHSTGIYTWAYLYWLGLHHEQLWQHYMARLHAAGFEGETGRDFVPPSVAPTSCSSSRN